MTAQPAARSWVDRLTARPDRPRGIYLQQAVLIAFALLAALAAMYMTFELGGSILWLVGADVLVIAACGRTAARIATIVGAAVGAGQGLLVIVLVAALLVAIPLLTPIFFAWNLVQAVRASEALPGEDGGWL